MFLCFQQFFSFTSNDQRIGLLLERGYGSYLQECENRPIGYPGTKFLPGGARVECTSLLAFRIVSASGAEYKRKRFPTQSLLPLCCPFCGPPEVLHLVSPSRHETRTTRQALKRLKNNNIFLGKFRRGKLIYYFIPVDSYFLFFFVVHSIPNRKTRGASGHHQKRREGLSH